MSATSPRQEWFTGWCGLIILYVVLDLQSAMWDEKWERGHLFYSDPECSHPQPLGSHLPPVTLDGVLLWWSRAARLSCLQPWRVLWRGTERGLFRDWCLMSNSVFNVKIDTKTQTSKEHLLVVEWADGWVGGNWTLRGKWAELLAWAEVSCRPHWDLRIVS